MISFFEWMKEGGLSEKRWCLLGKGPTFGLRGDVPDLKKNYMLLGLNHVCREEHVNVTHVIDLNVIDEVPDISSRTQYMVMPWHPHVKFVPSSETLDSFVGAHPTLKQMDREGRLLWYNASTWKGDPRPGCPTVRVVWFSAEAAVRLLAMSGVRTVRTLGIDGGSSYAEEFKDIKPFRGGHKTFDIQTAEIMKTVGEFTLDYKPFFGKQS